MARLNSGMYTRETNDMSLVPAQSAKPRLAPCAERMTAMCDGKMSLLSTNEKARHRMTTQAIAPAKAAVRPVWNSMGRKAMMVVSTRKWRVPRRVERPERYWRAYSRDVRFPSTHSRQ